jgi:hypothetical protein
LAGADAEGGPQATETPLSAIAPVLQKVVFRRAPLRRGSHRRVVMGVAHAATRGEGTTRIAMQPSAVGRAAFLPTKFTDP